MNIIVSRLPKVPQKNWAKWALAAAAVTPVMLQHGLNDSPTCSRQQGCAQPPPPSTGMFSGTLQTIKVFYEYHNPQINSIISVCVCVIWELASSFSLETNWASFTQLSRHSDVPETGFKDCPERTLEGLKSYRAARLRARRATAAGQGSHFRIHPGKEQIYRPIQNFILPFGRIPPPSSTGRACTDLKHLGGYRGAALTSRGGFLQLLRYADHTFANLTQLEHFLRRSVGTFEWLNRTNAG